jgi:hypothetical protein
MTEKDYKDFWKGPSEVEDGAAVSTSTPVLSRHRECLWDDLSRPARRSPRRPLATGGSGYGASPEYGIRPAAHRWNDFAKEAANAVRFKRHRVLDFTDPHKSLRWRHRPQLHSGSLGDMRFKDIYLRDLSRR